MRRATCPIFQGGIRVLDVTEDGKKILKTLDILELLVPILRDPQLPRLPVAWQTFGWHGPQMSRQPQFAYSVLAIVTFFRCFVLTD